MPLATSRSRPRVAPGKEALCCGQKPCPVGVNDPVLRDRHKALLITCVSDLKPAACLKQLQHKLIKQVHRSDFERPENGSQVSVGLNSPGLLRGCDMPTQSQHDECG